MSGQASPQWSPDPAGRFELRYWDGLTWTDHVSSGGRQSIDPLVQAPAPAEDAVALDAVGWHRDPSGRHELRYWDGRWTEHASSHGEQVHDPLPEATSTVAPSSATPSGAAQSPAPRPNRRVERQTRRIGARSGESGGTLLTENVLVVNQKAKLIGSTLSYAVYDQGGRQLGSVQEQRRDVTNMLSDRVRGLRDADRSYRFQVIDTDGDVVLAMTRPEQWFTMRSKMLVERADGSYLGHVAQETHGVKGAGADVLQAGATLLAMTKLGTVAGLVAGAAIEGVAERFGHSDDPVRNGHVRFGLEADGRRLGSIHAMSTDAWDFRVLDANGAEIGSVTKTWAGWAKERFTKADNYVVQMNHTIEEPLRSLVVAAALAIDVALKQGTQTSGSTVRGTRRYR